MNVDFRPTTQHDAAELADFLGRVFRLHAGAMLRDEAHMIWKYWTARTDWRGPRSFIALHHGAIVAHVALWPVCVRVAGQDVAAVQAVDWAADRNHAGAGTWLLPRIAAKLGARIPMIIATGGTNITQKILPAIGFRPHSEVYRFFRTLRPLQQALAASERNWKGPARLLRNTAWRMWRPLTPPRGWSAKLLAPEDIPDRLWPHPSSTTAVAARSSGLYRYFLDCPTVPHMLFGLHKHGEMAGFFSLALSPPYARIADIWLPSTDVEDWRAGLRTAAVLAADEKNIHEVSAWASTALGKEALARAGFLSGGRSTVSLLGDSKCLEGQQLHLQMLDSDASFLI